MRPQKGFGTLLPGETTDVMVRWTPRYTGAQEDVVCCRTLLVHPLNRSHLLSTDSHSYSHSHCLSHRLSPSRTRR